jgi:hypothetical protein
MEFKLMFGFGIAAEQTVARGGKSCYTGRVTGAKNPGGKSVFIKGLALCESFFEACVEPILRRKFPDLRYAAGLIGYGSDVLGYDDEVSTDHMWGPRLYIFLRAEDAGLAEALYARVAEDLPYAFRGYSVNFSAPDPDDGGIRHAEFITAGTVSPLLWIHTAPDFVRTYLGGYPASAADWLAASEHRLLGFTSGKIFRDDIGFEALRRGLRFYPEDVKRFLLASQWALIGEEQAFVRRCGDLGDETGSRIICARIAERLMRLCFLYSDRYAPYSNWFGAAFHRLEGAEALERAVSAALGENDIDAREDALVAAQLCAVQLHNRADLTERFDAEVQSYFSRRIRVLFVDRLAKLIREQIEDPRLRALPPIGALSQIGNFTELADDPRYRARIRAFYDGLAGGG